MTGMQTDVSVWMMQGNVVNGDLILYVCGVYLKQNGELDGQHCSYYSNVRI